MERLVTESLVLSKLASPVGWGESANSNINDYVGIKNEEMNNHAIQTR